MVQVKKNVSAAVFDGGKFVARYSIAHSDYVFHAKGGGVGDLEYPDSLPAPASLAIDAPDTAKAKPTAQIAKVKNKTATAADVRDAVDWLLHNSSQ